LDITVIETMTVPRIAMVVGRLFDGRIYTVKRVHHYKGRCVIVSSEQVREMEIDGEALGTTPVEFTIEDKRLRVLVP
jgi:diacylglycerol kinase family enzyme